jgi:thiamine biosynthesis lipoprotein ApbE
MAGYLPLPSRWFFGGEGQSGQAVPATEQISSIAKKFIYQHIELHDDQGVG